MNSLEYAPEPVSFLEPTREKKTATAAARNSNLDLLRAAAILLVLVYHIGEFMPNLPWLTQRYLELGAYGVDLFFVLSGWLIGTLIWKERARFGNLDLPRFWARRWLRTIPVYLVVLPIAFAGVYFARGEKFDPSYLLFLQNYKPQIPYFTVSWSLCVEEHFYLFLPLVLALLTLCRTPLRLAFPLLLGAAIAIPFLDPRATPGQPLGISVTATHLNLAGLILGLWMSYLYVNEPRHWPPFRRFTGWLIAPLLLGILLYPVIDNRLLYYFSDLYVGMLCAGILAQIVDAQAIGISRSKLIAFIAITSYSVYLTHAMVINALTAFADRVGVPRVTVVPVIFVAVFAIGGILYHLVEKPMLAVRDRAVPRRS